MSERRALPGRRKMRALKAKIVTPDGQFSLYVHTGEFEDGTLGEVFLRTNSFGADEQSLLGSTALSISLGLQHGTPLEAYVEAYIGTRFEPRGPVVGVDGIKMCTSPLDLVARWLAIEYLGRDDLAHGAGQP